MLWKAFEKVMKFLSNFESISSNKKHLIMKKIYDISEKFRKILDKCWRRYVGCGTNFEKNPSTCEPNKILGTFLRKF